MTIPELNSWVTSLPNTERANLMEFFEMLKVAHSEKLVLALTVNLTPRNEITYDTQKISFAAMKKLMLNN